MIHYLCLLRGKGSQRSEDQLGHAREFVVCRVFDKSSGVRKEPAELAPVSTPPYRTTMSGEGADLRSMSIPIPTLFHVGIQDFTMNSNDLHPLMGDPSASFYSPDGMGSSVPPPLLRPLLSPLFPMAGMGSIGLQMDNYFGNSTTINEYVSLYQQDGFETTNDYGFVTELDIIPMSLLLQDAIVCPDETNALHISSMVNPGHVASSTVDMDNIWI
ncbi:hypothetical protein EJB05_32013, partial [Eragrostis curvula]